MMIKSVCTRSISPQAYSSSAIVEETFHILKKDLSVQLNGDSD